MDIEVKQCKYELRNRITNILKGNNDQSIEKKIIKRKRDEMETNEISETDSDNEQFTWESFNKLIIPGNKKNIDDWVSATKIKNFLLKDTVIDWFDLYYAQFGFNNGSDKIVRQAKKPKIQNNNYEQKTQQLFFDMGNKFEAKIMDYLDKTYYGNTKKVVFNYVAQSDNNTTLKYMLEGIPIIQQAALYNHSNKTFGVADLLIRSDFINSMFEEEVIPVEMEKHKAKKLNGNFHYVVIDIKWTTMHLCADMMTIRNSDRFPHIRDNWQYIMLHLVHYKDIPQIVHVLAKSGSLDQLEINLKDIMLLIDLDI
jgi:hypothetical protein